MDLRWEILAGYGPLFLQGLAMTVLLTIVSLTLGMALGLTAGLVSSSGDQQVPAPWGWLLAAARWVVRAYVTFFRGTPLFVQILLVHFALMPLWFIRTAGGCFPARSHATSVRTTARSSPVRWR